MEKGLAIQIMTRAVLGKQILSKLEDMVPTNNTK